MNWVEMVCCGDQTAGRGPHAARHVICLSTAAGDASTARGPNAAHYGLNRLKWNELSWNGLLRWMKRWKQRCQMEFEWDKATLPRENGINYELLIEYCFLFGVVHAMSCYCHDKMAAFRHISCFSRRVNWIRFDETSWINWVNNS